jgi:organic hydroperoxide reductase OsmC/OhrA
MSHYQAVIEWTRDGARFTDNRYSRGHRWRFDGGIEVPASASPQVVPLPMSVAAAVDPEEAFVASLSSCHMLFFLALAAKQGFVVDDYRDEAVGVMAQDAGGKLAMTQVTLHPLVRYGGEKRPAAAEEDALHHAAHEECFIARSVRTVVNCEPIRAPD